VQSADSRRRRAAAAVESGYTLVELVVVLAIAAILAVVAAPRFLSISEMNADLYRSEVLAALRYAQRAAVATGCGVQVTFTATSYTLQAQNGCAGGTYTTAVVDPSTNGATYSRTAPSNVTLSSTVNPLRFDALGRALTSANAVSDAVVSVGARAIAVVGESGYARAT
jgi:MSHA pilin protein MshC